MPESCKPLKRAKYAIAVNAMPHHTAPKRDSILLYLNVKISRLINMTIAPTTNAMATEARIPDIMTSAFPELIKRDMSAAVYSGLALISREATAIAAPSRPNTSDTVVDVGSPKVLNRSSNITLANITPRNSIMISRNVNISG